MYKRSRKVRAPVATSSSVRHELASRMIILSGREYVDLVSASVPINSSSVFNTTMNLMRPTDTKLFSWMSGIAEKFEKYRFTRLCFTYEPQCPTSTSGSVAMWYDPDPTHTVPSTWGNMINTGVNAHGAPWTGHKLDLPSHVLSTRSQYYTKPEFGDANVSNSKTFAFASAAPTDPLEYFTGMYGFATQDIGPGGAAVVQYPIGKVYLDYTIALAVQAVDQWNLTSLVTNVPVSAEQSSNSGNGLVMKGITPSATAQTLYLLGILSGGLIGNRLKYNSAGSDYFSVNDNSGICTVRGNCDLALQFGITASIAPTHIYITVTRGSQADVAPGTVYTLDSFAGTMAPAVSGLWVPYSMYPGGLNAAMAFFGQLRLYAGDRICVSMLFGGVATLSDVNMYWMPQPLGITL